MRSRNARAISVWAISLNYWPVFSGAGVQAQRLYSALVDEGFQCTVLTARHDEASSHPRRETRDGVQIRRLTVLPTRWSSSPLFGAAWRMLCRVFFALACDLRILVACRRIDVLHIHGAFLPAIVPLARLLRIPVVVKQTMLEPRGRRLGARLQHWGLVKADKVIMLSRAMSEQYGELPASKLEVIPQGVDTSLFRPVSAAQKKARRKALGLDPDAFLVVFVGSVEHRKGVDILVRAFIDLGTSCPGLGLILIGPREFAAHHEQHLAQERQRYREGLEAALAEHGLDERVVWTDALPPKEVVSYLQAADLFCLPSRREGVPSALLEAMACGLPGVVSSLDGTSAELLTDGDEGFIVDNENVAQYARRISALAADGELARRMGERGRRRVEQAFSFRKANERYRQLFRSLARRTRDQ